MTFGPYGFQYTYRSDVCGISWEQGTQTEEMLGKKCLPGQKCCLSERQGELIKKFYLTGGKFSFWKTYANCFTWIIHNDPEPSLDTASLGAQTVKSLPATQETRVQSLEEDAPLEK